MQLKKENEDRIAADKANKIADVENNLGSE